MKFTLKIIFPQKKSYLKKIIEMKKVTFIIPLLFAGIVSTAQNVSEDSQVSGNGEVTVFSREEILARIAENRLNNAAANSNDSTTSNIASGRLTATGDEGITTLETETSGSGSLEATFNGETVAQEPSTAVPNEGSVAPDDSPVSGNGGVTIFSREEILARFAQNRQNDEPTVSTGSTGPSFATANVTSTAGEGITELETETSGNATLTVTSNGEIIVEEPAAAAPAAPVTSNDTPTSTNIASGRLTATGSEGITSLETETSGNGSLEATFNGETVAQQPAAAPVAETVEEEATDDSQNGGVTVFSREEILARVEANRQNDEPAVSTGATGPSIATANVTSTAGEGITELETETSGNATLTVVSNGETIVEEEAPTLQVATPQVEREAVRVRLFPNPVRRSLVVLTPRAQFSRVEISSPNGELVKSENINNLSRARLDVSDLQQGLYFISIYSNGGRTVERFFKR